jgi:hypothetical protein
MDLLETISIEPTVVILQIIGLLFFIALPVWALFRLRSSQVSGLALVLWVIVIIVIPLLGPLAFFIVRPGHSESS